MIWIYFEEALLWWFAETHTNPFNGPLSVTTQVSQYQKGKTNLDFAEARDSEWQWHQLGHVHCKSAPRSRQITTPAPHHLVFTGRMPFLLPSQQHQSTEFDFLWNKQRGRKPNFVCFPAAENVVHGLSATAEHVVLCVVCADSADLLSAWICWNGWNVDMATSSGRHKRCHFKWLHVSWCF